MPPSSNKSLVDFFTRSLGAFQTSADSVRILCTIHGGAKQSDYAAASAVLSRKPRRRVQNLIVLDSSFNPPTVAHGAMLRSAIETFRGSHRQAATGGSRCRILLLLSVNNADKAAQPATFTQRLCMMERFGKEILAEISGHRDAQAADTNTEDGDGEASIAVDLGVTTFPYFHDKAAAISASSFYQVENVQPGMTFLVGFDTLIRILNPKYYKLGIEKELDPFFKAAGLRVTVREDDEWGSAEEQRRWLDRLKDDKDNALNGDAICREEWLDKVVMVEGMGKSISSSRVRNCVQSGEGSLDGLVGDEVRQWMEEANLYKQTPS